MGEIRVGTAGWTDRSLIASGWYPPEANNPEKRLRYYARQWRARSAQRRAGCAWSSATTRG